MEDHPVGLAHDVGQHIEAAAVGHAHGDLLHAHLATALDDLLQGGNDRFRALQAEALCAGVLGMEELFESLRLDQLGQDGFLAETGEGDLLVRPLDALLDPGLLLRVGDVHELVAEMPAVGAFQDGQDLVDGAPFHAEHAVEKDPAFPVLVRPEAVRGGVELGVWLRLTQPQRIEIGGQMSAHAVGADHHQGTHGILRLGLDLLRIERTAVFAALAGELPLDLLQGGPVLGEGRSELVRRQRWPVVAFPGGAGDLLLDAFGVIAQRGEEFPPLRIHGGGILQPLQIEFLDVVRVGSGEERGATQDLCVHVGIHGSVRAFRPVPPDACVVAVVPFLQDLPTSSAMAWPMRAGERTTVAPAASSASILAWAVPLPPEMMAPAWPMRRPGGAVTPAM